MSKIFIPHQPLPLEKVEGQSPAKARRQPGQQSFQVLLSEKLDEAKLQFSAHALKRLEERNIRLKEEDLGKLGQAVSRAAAKGSRSSLLVYRDMAFVAGVQSKTIITAMDGESMKEHVFTNIDSAVFVE